MIQPRLVFALSLFAVLFDFSESNGSLGVSFLRQDCGSELALQNSGLCAVIDTGHGASSPAEAETYCASAYPGGAGVLRIHTQTDLDDLSAHAVTAHPAGPSLDAVSKLWTGLVYIPGVDTGQAPSPNQLQPKQHAGQWFWLDRSPATFAQDPPEGIFEAMADAVNRGLHCMRLSFVSARQEYTFEAAQCDSLDTATACSFTQQMKTDSTEFIVLENVDSFGAADSLCRQHGFSLVTVNTPADLETVHQLLPASSRAWTGAKRVPRHAGTGIDDFYWAAGHAWGAYGDMVRFAPQPVGDCILAAEDGPEFKLVDWPCSPLPPAAVPTHAVCMYDPAEMDFMQCPFGYLRFQGACYSMNRARSLGRNLEFFQEQCSFDEFAYPITLKSEGELDWVLERFFVPLSNSSSAKGVVLGQHSGATGVELPVDTGWLWIDSDLDELASTVNDDLAVTALALGGQSEQAAILQFVDPRGKISQSSVLDRSAVRILAPNTAVDSSAFFLSATICKMPVRAARKCSRGWIPLLNKCYAVTDAAVDEVNAGVACHVMGGVLADGGVPLERQLLMPTLRGIPAAADGVWVDVSMTDMGGTHTAQSARQPTNHQVLEEGITGYAEAAGSAPVLRPLQWFETLDSTMHTWEARDKHSKLPALCVRHEQVSCPTGPNSKFGTQPIGLSRQIPYGWVLHQESWYVHVEPTGLQ